MAKPKTAFDKWLDTFIEEKGIDVNETFEINTNDNLHIFDYAFVIETIKQTTKEEQKKIKAKIVYLDFFNKDIKHFLRHLAKALI
jgi:hypothetical protein